MRRTHRWVCLVFLQACWGGYLAEGARPESSFMVMGTGGYVESPVASKRTNSNPKPPDDGLTIHPVGGSSAAGAFGFSLRYAPNPYLQLSLASEVGFWWGPGFFGGVLPGVKVLLTPQEPAIPLYLALAIRGTFLRGGQGDYTTFVVLGGEAFVPLSWVVSPAIELYWALQVGFEQYSQSGHRPRPADWGNYDYVVNWELDYMWAGAAVGLLWDVSTYGTTIGFELYGGSTIADVLDGAGGWRLGLAFSLRLGRQVYGIAPNSAPTPRPENDEPEPRGEPQFWPLE